MVRLPIVRAIRYIHTQKRMVRQLEYRQLEMAFRIPKRAPERLSGHILPLECADPFALAPF